MGAWENVKPRPDSSLFPRGRDGVSRKSWWVDPPQGDAEPKRFDTKKAATQFITEQIRIESLPASARRELYSTDLPCTCGAPFAEHRRSDDYEPSWCPNGTTRFEHAPTDPIEPDPHSNLGHIFGGEGKRLYVYARRVLFHNLPGDTDVEVAPHGDDPEQGGIHGAFKRRLISGRAIGRTFHHSRKCPCGGGYWP